MYVNTEYKSDDKIGKVYFLIESNNSLIYFLFALYCPDRDFSLSLKLFGKYRYECTGNGNQIPVLNIFGLPFTGNGRNSITNKS